MNIINKIFNHHKIENILVLSLKEYEGYNISLELDYDVNDNTYYIIYDDDGNELYNSKIVIPANDALMIVNIINQLRIYEYNDLKDDIKTEIVEFKANIDDRVYNYTFNSFVPENLLYLSDILYFLFMSLPKKYFPLFEELIAKLNKTEYKYTYKKAFKFDLYRGKLSNIFDDEIIKRGEDYYNNQRVRFVERIKDSYYATIEGSTGIYTVIIDYDNKTKMTKMYCSCPCEFFCKHMYATIKCIRNKEFYKYYKVRYIEENADLYNKMFSQNYYLSLGLVDDKITLLMPDGSIKTVYVLDKDKKPMFEVVEEDDEKSLSNKIKELG